mmetsp:Transcript_19768/g.49749  ORF Transcript_19768/g.49749 Transcript_19768/m.49749 type:complete len:387 (+) Transcript_19768:2610-3770(+)
MLLEEHEAGFQIGVVVLIGDAPPDRPELTPLLHHGVEDRLDESDLAPLLVINLFQRLLRHHGRVGTEEPCLQTRRRFRRDLDRHLQQSNRERFCNLDGEPQAEVFVDLRRLCQNILLLHHEPDTQVAILQNHPRSVQEPVLHFFPRDDFLPFAHTHFIRRELLFLLRELVDGRRGIGTRSEQVQYRLAARRLVEDVGYRVRHRRRKPPSQVCIHKLRTRDAGTILADRPDQHHAHYWTQRAFHDQAFFVVRHRAALGLVFIEPALPRGFVLRHVVHDLAVEGQPVSERMPRQVQQVQPDFVREPAERVWSFALHVQRGTRLQEAAHVRTGDVPRDGQNLQRDHQLERHFIPLKEAAVHVPVHLVGEVVDDLVHALRRRLHLLGVHD